MFYKYMKITSIKKQYHFKSGLSKEDIKRLNRISTSKTEKYFRTLNTSANFSDNKTYSALNLICSKILNTLGNSKYFNSLDFFKKPAQIRVFEKNHLCAKYPDTFCTIVSKKILDNEPVFKPPGLFFYDSRINFEEMNELAKNANKERIISTDSFLAFVMHEWIHSVHFNYLYSKLNYDEKSVMKYIKHLKEFEFTNEEKELILEYLGSYSFINGHINPVETVSEGLNKVVCSCLDKNQLKINCSIDEAVEKMPPELINLIKKIIEFE